MDAERIKKIRDSKEAARIRQDANYQASGDDNYYRKARGYEEIVEICNQALTTADDHTKAIHMASTLARLATQAAKIIHQAERGAFDEREAQQVLRNIMSAAEDNGWANRYT